MDIEKKEVKVEVKAAEPVAAKAPAAAKKPAAKKAAAKKPAAKKAAAPAKKAAAKKPAAKKAAAKKPAAKKAAAPKKVEIFFQIDGQEISNAAIAKKLPKAAKIWVNVAEKKAYDESGKGVDLF